MDLSLFNVLQDTTSLVFTKQYGFRFSSIASTYLTEAVCVADIDFNTADPGDLGDTAVFTTQARQGGVGHVVMCHWEVFGDKEKTLRMSTDPAVSNFPRDMQWGQALQLVEDNTVERDEGTNSVPVPFEVTAGENITMEVRFSSDNVVMQFLLKHSTPP